MTSSIAFGPSDGSIEVLRLSRDGIWANPDVPVDDAAKLVLAAIDSNIRLMVEQAVKAERAAMMQLFTDPENQPTQHGTVTVAYMQHEIAAEREACAKMAEEVSMGKRWFNDLPSDIRARGHDPMPLFDDWPGGFKE